MFTSSKGIGVNSLEERAYNRAEEVFNIIVTINTLRNKSKLTLKILSNYSRDRNRYLLYVYPFLDILNLILI